MLATASRLAEPSMSGMASHVPKHTGSARLRSSQKTPSERLRAASDGSSGSLRWDSPSLACESEPNSMMRKPIRSIDLALELRLKPPGAKDTSLSSLSHEVSPAPNSMPHVCAGGGIRASVTPASQ